MIPRASSPCGRRLLPKRVTQPSLPVHARIATRIPRIVVCVPGRSIGAAGHRLPEPRSMDEALSFDGSRRATWYLRSQGVARVRNRQAAGPVLRGLHHPLFYGKRCVVISAMAEMKCPQCGLYNPGIAQRCDCGYDFGTKTMMPSYLDATTERPAIPPRLFRVGSAAAFISEATLLLLIATPGFPRLASLYLVEVLYLSGFVTWGIWRAQDRRSVQMVSAVAVGALLAVSILGSFSIGLAVLPGTAFYVLAVGVLSARFRVGLWSLLCATAGASGQAAIMLGLISRG
jgi:hypothetical protein